MKTETASEFDLLRKPSRREMLKQSLMAAILLPQDLGRGGQWGRGGPGGPGGPGRNIDPSQIPSYRYKTLPVSRFPQLQAEYEKSLSGTLYTQAKAFRDEVAKLSFKTPADFPTAKSVVVVAAFTKSMYVNFTLNGSKLRVLVPPQYYEPETNAAKLKGIVQNEIVKSGAAKVVDISKSVPLKLLAARSGLGQYGRNNLIFVNGMGSYCLLYAFLTDHNFGEDNWTQLSVLEPCNRCDHCVRGCPTWSVPDYGNFPINVEKCVTFYNERQGTFPTWIQRSSHGALMGCMGCQTSCKEDRGYAEVSGTLEEVSEAETQQILKGIAGDALLVSLQRKLKGFPALESKTVFPILSRNLTVLTRA
jgi:epoxyqueuosine reductase